MGSMEKYKLLIRLALHGGREIALPFSMSKLHFANPR